MLLQRVSEILGDAHDVAALEAHRTGTTLGDPVEIGAAGAALRDSTLACTSIKGNIGHLEAAAAIIGLNWLLLFPLSSMLNAPLCTLRSINSHLKSLNLNAFYFLTGLANLQGGKSAKSSACCGRLSSFGYSGTIAHGAFEACRSEYKAFIQSNKSLYRSRHIVASRSAAPARLNWLAESHGVRKMSHLDKIVVFSGALTLSAELLFLDHVVGGNILFPGVGYVEMAFAANLDQASALTTVAFVRPCILPNPRLGTSKRCELRCTRRETGGIEIASRVTGSSTKTSFASCFVGTLASCGGVSKVNVVANPFRKEYVALATQDANASPSRGVSERIGTETFGSVLPSWVQGF